jgi:hypothetical protein
MPKAKPKAKAIRKKKVAPKSLKKAKPLKSPKGTKRTKEAKAKEIGVIAHYFPKVMAAVVKLKGPLSVGDTVAIKGHTTDFTQQIISIQLDHASLQSAKKGQEIGFQVVSRVRRGDSVTKK